MLFARIAGEIFLETVHDGECRTILGKNVTFFDIHSTKAKQYGFCMDLRENKKLTCLGDEPYHENSLRYVQDSDIKTVNRHILRRAEGITAAICSCPTTWKRLSCRYEQQGI